MSESWDITLAGRGGVLFQYDGTTDFTALWTDGERSLELRGVFDIVDDYRTVAATLAYVGEERWLSAMPANAVAPSERGEAVEAMLEDIPVHPSVDVEKLKSEDVVKDRYQLGAQVTGAVVCAWIEQWLVATAKGDTAAEKAAVEAMATSRRWAILEEMRKQGGWSQVVWEYATAIESGRGEVSAGKRLSVGDGYKSALGCPRGE